MVPPTIMCANKVWGTLHVGLAPWTCRPMDPTMDGRTMDRTVGRGRPTPLLLTSLGKGELKGALFKSDPRSFGMLGQVAFS